MKLIASHSGALAIRARSEDVMPPKRPPVHDVIEAMVTRYKFLGVSDANQSPILFQNGKLDEDGSPIIQLQSMPTADVVFSTDTSAADRIFEDIIVFLDLKFGIKIEKAIRKKTYLSAVVVEFDRDTKNLLSSMCLIENILSKINLSNRKLKRLSFGLLEHDNGLGNKQPLTPVDAIEQAEFFMERRLGSTWDENRFFCSAPLKTEELIRTLEEIEAICSSNF